MSAKIVNASPQIINLGADDKSLKPKPPKPIIISTHTALCFTYAESGPTNKQPVDVDRITPLFGAGTFDRSKPFFNHATRMLETITGAGNSVMIKRVVPEDNNTIANVTIYADIIKDNVDVYKRNQDGSIYYDEDGNPDVDDTVKGYKIKIIAEWNDDDINTPVGARKAKEGYMKDDDDNKSTMYPIFELRGKYKGAKYNNYGFAFNVPTNEDLNMSYLETNRALPYEFHMFERANAKSTGTVIKSLLGATNEQFVLDPNGTNPISNEKIYLKNIMGDWYNLSNPLRDLVYPKFEEPFVYQENLDNILKNIMDVEKDYVNADVECEDGTVVNTAEWLDYLSDVDPEDQFRIVNPFTTLSTKRVPGFTFVLDDTDVDLDDNQQEVFFSKMTPIYLGKGKDGTLSEENFNKEVVKFMQKYVDRNSEVMSLATNLENTLYDSGFPLDIKKELINFIKVRKDTFLGLATREDFYGDKYIDLIMERAIGLNLKAALNLAPESTFYGTSVARAIVVAGSGIDLEDPAGRRYSLLFNLVQKIAKMMGGTKWNKNLLFDRGDKNIIENMADIQPSFIPDGIKPEIWNIGLIWAQEYDNESYHFPAMQTIYDKDGSVLNNIFMAIALTTANKVAAAAWRKFTGVTSLSPDELLSEIDTYMNGELKDKFDGVITASCKASFTDFDEQTGYSWSVVTKLGGEIMKTVMTHHIETWRKEDM